MAQDKKSVGQVARGLFAEERFYCAESVLLAVARAKGVDNDIIPRMATGFCSGRARTCGQGGALSGAILALGLFLGRDAADDSVDTCYEAVGALVRSFATRFGGEDCDSLLGCDLGSPEGREFFNENMLLDKYCLDFVEYATDKVMELLGDMEYCPPDRGEA